MNEGNSQNRTIAIASGKGGVGKTFIAANLGLAIARYSSPQRVVAVDLDLGCSNLNTCLGVRNLDSTISDFLFARKPELNDILTTTAQHNLDMIGGSNGMPIELPSMPDWKERINEAIQHLDVSFSILDLAAGAGPEVIDFFLAARERVVVIVPESLSLHNGFIFIKTAILRLVDMELGRFEYLLPVRDKVRELMASTDNIELKTLLEKIREWDLIAGYVVRGIIDELRIKLIINMYRGGQERTYLQRFHKLLLKHLFLRNFEYLGVVHFGRNVRRAVQGVRPFLLTYPQDYVSIDISKIAMKLVQNQEDLEPKLTFPESRWFENLLKK